MSNSVGELNAGQPGLHGRLGMEKADVGAHLSGLHPRRLF